MPDMTAKNKDGPAILTVSEVAEYLRMSQAKVYRLAKERQLPVFRIGKTWRFRKDLLDEWLSKCSDSSMTVHQESHRDHQ
jgi:excisionase family DNA binding protein